MLSDRETSQDLLYLFKDFAILRFTQYDEKCHCEEQSDVAI